MSGLRCAVYLAGITALLNISHSARSAAAPDAADLARCAQIAAPDARLACFDALSSSAKRAAPVAPAAPGIAPPPAAAVTSATSAAPASDPRNFGLTQTQIQPVPQGPAAIEARVAKLINTRYGSNYVVLDNGQTWAYTDSDQDERLVPGDKVTIRRASLGSFLMKTPSRNAYHVRRTQ
jgi:hypothetical protein